METLKQSGFDYEKINNDKDRVGKKKIIHL